MGFPRTFQNFDLFCPLSFIESVDICQRPRNSLGHPKKLKNETFPYKVSARVKVTEMVTGLFSFATKRNKNCRTKKKYFLEEIHVHASSFWLMEYWEIHMWWLAALLLIKAEALHDCPTPTCQAVSDIPPSLFFFLSRPCASLVCRCEQVPSNARITAEIGRRRAGEGRERRRTRALSDRQ